MRRIPQFIFTLLAIAAASTPAWAVAQCPANPLATLGGPWTFNIQSEPSLFVHNYGIVGIFNANIGTDRAGNSVGVLRINGTSRIDFSTTRLEDDIGSFQINANCSGGTLTFNLSSRPFQFDFWFFNGGLSMNIVGTIEGKPVTGTAHRGPLGCPAGLTDPLTLLSGAYSFKLQSLWWNVLDPVDPAYVIAGRFTASNGALKIVATSQLTGGGSPARLEQDAGTYQINSDCSGGTLSFHLSSRPVQFQFYFRADQVTLDIISTTGPTVYGIATRAPAAGCPANALSILSTPLTFNVQTLFWPNFSIRNYAAAGQLRPSIGVDRAGNPIGLLTVNATAFIDGSVARLETDAGRYQINGDCTGGTLTFNLSSYPQQYDFWFYNGGIFMVSTLAGSPMTGSAVPAPTACPLTPPPPPLNLLTGDWSFRIRAVQSQTARPVNDRLLSSAGLMTASIGADRAGNPLGVLSITATSITGVIGSITRLETDAGRYTVNADCSGGTLTFNMSSMPVQFEYYFRAGFNEFDAIAAGTNGPFSYGLFSR